MATTGEPREPARVHPVQGTDEIVQGQDGLFHAARLVGQFAPHAPQIVGFRRVRATRGAQAGRERHARPMAGRGLRCECELIESPQTAIDLIKSPHYERALTALAVMRSMWPKHRRGEGGSLARFHS